MAKSLGDLPSVGGKWYTASFHQPSGQIRICAKRSKFYMFVPLVSACDAIDRRDVTRGISDIRLKKSGTTSVLTYTEKSDLWDRKLYTVEFGPECIRYYYKVMGQGSVGRAYFFRSWFEAPNTVENELGVIPGFDTVYNPAVNFWGKDYYFAGDRAIMTSGDSKRFWGQGLVSAPYCYGLSDHGDGLWVGAGLGVRPGQYDFEEYNYNTNETNRVFGPGGFDCNYNGKLHVDGSWESPHMLLFAAGDEGQMLKRYVGMLKKDYGLELAAKRDIPQWWRTPIFCGWGEQMSLGFRDHGNFDGVQFGAYCTQSLHDEWMATLAQKKIRVGQVIIDAGWEKDGTTGDMYVDEQRWPDLRGWIENQRASGVRVLLWMMAWSRRGVPDDECIIDAQGKAVGADPTNPAYEKRLRAMIRRMLSSEEGCYNADGLKIDGELTCPQGPGLKNKGNVWGLELQRRYLSIVRDEARKHKPDAVMGLYMANPYMADLADVARVADLFGIKGDPTAAMNHRASLLAITNPASPIDTDHAFYYDVRENYTDIMAAQMAIPGAIPCLYHAKYVWHKHPFMPTYMDEMTDEHYAAVRKAFNRCWRDLSAKGKWQP